MADSSRTYTIEQIEHAMYAAGVEPVDVEMVIEILEEYYDRVI